MDQPESIVYVVDDDQAVCESLHWLMTSVGLPVRIFTSAREFLEAYQPDQQGCIVLDIRMPGMSGFELQKRLAAQHDKLPVIFLTGHGDVNIAVAAMRAGAFDFFEKPIDDQLLLDAVQKAVEKSEKTTLDHVHMAEIQRRRDSLSPREREVLDLILIGEPNKRIAVRMGVGEKTVEAHRAKVMEKMRAKSLARLFKLITELNSH